MGKRHRARTTWYKRKLSQTPSRRVTVLPEGSKRRVLITLQRKSGSHLLTDQVATCLKPQLKRIYKKGFHGTTPA
jgi:hypothetical protein